MVRLALTRSRVRRSCRRAASPSVDLGGDVEQARGPLGRDHAGRRQRRAPGGPQHQRHAGLRLERGDPGRHRLLGDAEFARGRVQAAAARDGQQHLQGAQLGHPRAQYHATQL